MFSKIFQLFRKKARKNKSTNIADKAEADDNMSEEKECCTEDNENMEHDRIADVCQSATSDSNDDTSDTYTCPSCQKKMDDVFQNELIFDEIMMKLSVGDRLKAKSVCSMFFTRLTRRKFLKEEFITFNENFTLEEIKKLEQLGLLDRAEINLSFNYIESFKDHPKKFWEHHCKKVQMIRFNGCGISYEMLEAVLVNSYKNILEISTVACFFDDDSGWAKRTVVENDPLVPIFFSTNSSSNPKREKGKLILRNVVGEFVRRFILHSSSMFVYSDMGKVQTFVFEYPCELHYIAFRGWNVQDVTLYNEIKLDASPTMVPGWSSFRSFLKTKDVDTTVNPKWVHIENVKDMAILYNNDPDGAQIFAYITKDAY